MIDERTLTGLAKPWLLVTDLDGTLLDHHDYSHSAVDKLLVQLEHECIPVIFNTSKTAAELFELRRELNNRHPFIVENGSAIYLPPNYFSRPLAGTSKDDNHGCIVLGRPAVDIHHWLNRIGRRLPGDFIGFADMDVKELMRLTGLNNKSAQLAGQRRYSEAIQWLGSEQQRNDFCREARAAGFQVLQGGRFLHLLGQCDKATAMVRLQSEYALHWSRSCSVIAAGDSQNDVAMLEAADLAIAVRSPVHDFPHVDSPRVIRTSQQGPNGWAEIVQRLIEHHARNSGASSD